MVDKKVIVDVLKKSIHDLLQANELIDLVEIEDSVLTQNLCSTIEALFIHGLNKNHSSIFRSKFGRTKHSYEYDFWNYVKGYVPKNLLNVLENQSVKFTPVGLSRVWLRYSLNECTILSYLDSMRSDVKRLQQFYSKDALIRDDEKMEMFCGLLTSIQRIPFNLNTSSSLLNTWLNSDALKIAGVEVVSSVNNESLDRYNLINDPLSKTLDKTSLCASSTNEEHEEILTTDMFHSLHRYSSSVPQNNTSAFPIYNSFQQPVKFSEESDQVEGIIKITEEDKKSEISNTEENLENENEEFESENIFNMNFHSSTNEFPENEIKKPGNPFDENDNIPIDEAEVSVMASDKMDSPNISMRTPSENDNTSCDSKSIHVINESYDQIWAQHQSLVTQMSIESINIADNRSIDNSGVTESMAGSSTSSSSNLSQSKEMKRLMDIFPGVDLCSTDNGLNSVFGGRCSKCDNLLETGRAMIDNYDGKLFCTICESSAKAVIPRNVIYNWDFEPKIVSETTKRFLSEIIIHPNINLANHSNLFSVIPDLARVRLLRHKLNLLWLQVTSCDIEISKKMRETMFPREYMLASLKENDLYSLEDLIILQSGVLEKTLLHVINKVAIPHVIKCPVCRMKAMPCDKCKDNKRVIYIHEIDDYFECTTPYCKSVIHKGCKISANTSFYCRRCIQFLENQQPLTVGSYDTANCFD